MNIKVNRKALVAELAQLARLKPQSAPIPTLGHVWAEASEDQLRLTVTNLDQWLTVTLPTNGGPDGTMLIPFKSLQKTVKLLDSEEVKIARLYRNSEDINRCEDQAEISGNNNCRFELPIMEVENFPEMPTVEGEWVSRSKGELAETANEVAYACAREEPRFTLNGILYRSQSGKLTAAATDGHRLAVRAVPFSGPEFSAIVPLAAVKLFHWLDKFEDAAFCIGAEKWSTFRFGHRTLITRNLSGRFPDYGAVVPKNNNVRVTVDAGDLASALKRIGAVADPQSKAIQLHANNGNLKVSAQSADIGRAEEALTRQGEGALEAPVGFNWSYLLDYVSRQGGPLHIDLKNAETQGLLSADSSPTQYVVMPLKI